MQTAQLGCRHTALTQIGSRRCRPTARGRFRVQAAVLTIPREYSKVEPKGDLVLVEVAEAEAKTTGGVLLPTAAQKKPTSGDIAALGDGRQGTQTREFTTKPGDTVLYSKFGIGCTDVSVQLIGLSPPSDAVSHYKDADVAALQGKDYTLIREDDLIGVLPRSGATAADVPELQPLSDRVLLKVQDVSDVTAGGVLLPDSAKEKPIAGTVVATGPGRREEDGTRKEPRVAKGDQVLYFKWAGDNMETPSGEKYVVVHEQDILCKTS